jgi:hypothetical protein
MFSKYNAKDITLVISIFIIAYIYSLVYAPSIENKNNTGISKTLAELNKSCLVMCQSDECANYIEGSRGDNYFISTPKEKQKDIKKCILTFWGFTHFLLYFILGYMVPGWWMEFFIIGVGFELYEYREFKCHDINDIYLNSFGILLGKLISPY